MRALLLLALALPASAVDWSAYEAERRGLLTHAPAWGGFEGRGKPEEIGRLDLERLEISAQIARGLPQRAQFTLRVRIVEPLEGPLPLLAFAYEPTSVLLDGAPLNFRAANSELLIDLPNGQPRVITLEIAADLDLPCAEDPLACQDGDPAHLLLPWYPVNLDTLFGDFFEVRHCYQSDVMLPTGSGVLVGGAPEGGRWCFEAEIDASLIALAVNTAALQRHAGDFILEYRPAGARDRLMVPLVQQIVAFYEELLGLFPFSQLALAAIGDRAGAAVGPQAMILLPQTFWQSPEDIRNRPGLKAEVVAHEVGHQYFFNAVHITDPEEGWLSEGFAEYLATRYSEALTGTRDHARRDHWLFLLGVEPSDPTPLAAQHRGETRFQHLYMRGASVLHQLRGWLGEEDFDRRLRQWVAVTTGQIATTQEFEAIIGQSNPPLVQQYFQRWVYQGGYPVYEVSSTVARTDRSATQLSFEQIDGPRRPLQLFLTEHFPDGEQRSVQFEAGDGAQVDLSPGVQSVEIDPGLRVFQRSYAALPGDTNLDGLVDGLDLLEVYAHLEQEAPHPHWKDTRDTNRDQRVDARDLRTVEESFGAGW